jgi:small subunit ribosomal protein S2e
LAQEKEWQPVTKLGRLVKAGKIKSMEEMYVYTIAQNARDNC